MSKIDDDAWEITYRLVEIYFRGRKPPTPEELTRVARQIYEDLGTGREQERKAHQMSAESHQSRQEHIRSEYLKAHPLAKRQQRIDQAEEGKSPAPTAPKGEGNREKHRRLMRQAPEIATVVQLRGSLAAMDEFGISSYVTLAKILKADEKRIGESAKAQPGLLDNEVVVQRSVHQLEMGENQSLADRFEPKMTLDGKQIQELRHAIGLSVMKLATKLDVACGTVYRWEKGKSKPLPTYQKKLWQLWEMSDERKALKGEVNSNSKVPTELAEIRRLRESGQSLRAIGRIYGRSPERIRQLSMKSPVRKRVALAPEEIKRSRSLRGMTQEQMAKEVGVSVTTVRRWELGITTPSPLAQSKLRKLIRKR